jgi:hypothetical protein
VTDFLPKPVLEQELLPVTSVDHDQIRLLARHEIVAVLRWKRRAWIHTLLLLFSDFVERLIPGSPYGMGIYSPKARSRFCCAVPGNWSARRRK